MKNGVKKTVAVVIAVIIISALYPFAPVVKETRATGLPVIDVASILEETFGISQSAAQFIQKYVIDGFLAALKHRLLTMMTNNIVDWINNGGKPKFTTDFGSVFTDAADQAVGDVLQQYSATNALCQPFAFDVTLQLQQPAPLSQQVSCSLTSVISNFKAYRDNFSDGGWLGYQELLKPQNNEWGVEVITQNEIVNRTAQKTNASILQQQVNVGFNSEECTGGWDLIDTRNGKPAKVTVGGVDYGPHTAPDKARAPDNPPPLPPELGSTFKYRCTSATVTTPGSTLAAGLQEATYGKDFNFIINSQDLSNSLAIIADAAFNRIIKSGVKGLQDFTKTESGTLTGQEQSDVAGASTGYQNSINQVAESSRNVYLRQLSQAADDLSSASTTLGVASSTNQEIIATGNELLLCLGPTNINSPDGVFAQGAIDDANNTIQTIANKSTQWKIATSTLGILMEEVSSPACGLTCLNQINQQDMNDAASTASTLNADSGSILTSIQNTLSDLNARKTNDCHI
ncbi:MAG: hypothetical protein ABSF47_02140 [Minisyncoccia bacterium]|jgi:hypothetical protein